MDHRKAKPDLYDVPWSTDAFHDMPYRRLGGSGLQVSAVGLGTWKIGYPETGDGSRVGEATALQILDRALELGVTFWDTANRYNAASGNSERVIGTWMQENPDQRRNIVLATKLFGGMDGTTPNHSGLSRTNIMESLYASLERLCVDYVDLLYFHSFDPVTPVEESLAAVEDLMRQDLVRYFGMSNYTVDQVSLYQSAAPLRCRPVAVQNQFDLLNGESEEHQGVLDQAARAGFSFVAWSPLGRGLLTERYLDEEEVGPGDRLVDEGSWANLAEDEELMDRVRRLAELAHVWDLELNQLALAYMLTLPGMGPVIPAVSKVEHLESNAAAGRVTLAADQQLQVKKVLSGEA